MIDSADSSTNTRRSHEVTSFSTPTGLARPVSVISSPRAGGQPATAPPRLPTRLGVFGPHPLRRPAGGLAPLGRLDALLLRRRPRVRRVHPQPTPQRRGHPKIIPTEPTKINTVRAAYSPRTIQLKKSREWTRSNAPKVMSLGALPGPLTSPDYVGSTPQTRDPLRYRVTVCVSLYTKLGSVMNE